MCVNKKAKMCTTSKTAFGKQDVRVVLNLST